MLGFGARTQGQERAIVQPRSQGLSSSLPLERFGCFLTAPPQNFSCENIEGGGKSRFVSVGCSLYDFFHRELSRCSKKIYFQGTTLETLKILMQKVSTR